MPTSIALPGTTVTQSQAATVSLGVAAAQTAYALNNGSGLVVGQPLSYIDDSANLAKPGTQPLNLSIPAGFIVQGVYKNDDNGADVYVAYNAETHQVVVGCAGTNGVGKDQPDTVADAIDQGTGQAAWVLGNSDFQSVMQNIKSIDPDVNVTVSGQSMGGVVAQMISVGLTTQTNLTDANGNAIAPIFNATNVNGVIVNSPGCTVGLNAWNVDPSTLTTLSNNYTNIIVANSANGQQDVVSQLGGPAMGLTYMALANDPNATGTNLDNIPILHMFNGEFTTAFNQSGQNFMTMLQPVANPAALPSIDTSSLSSNMYTIAGLLNTNDSYLSLAATALLSIEFSQPGETADAISSVLQLNGMSQNAANILGGMGEFVLRVAPLVNPLVFVELIGGLYTGGLVSGNTPAYETPPATIAGYTLASSVGAPSSGDTGYRAATYTANDGSGNALMRFGDGSTMTYIPPTSQSQPGEQIWTRPDGSYAVISGTNGTGTLYLPIAGSTNFTQVSIGAGQILEQNSGVGWVITTPVTNDPQGNNGVYTSFISGSASTTYSVQSYYQGPTVGALPPALATIGTTQSIPINPEADQQVTITASSANTIIQSVSNIPPTIISGQVSTLALTNANVTVAAGTQITVAGTGDVITVAPAANGSTSDTSITMSGGTVNVAAGTTTTITGGENILNVVNATETSGATSITVNNGLTGAAATSTVISINAAGTRTLSVNGSDPITIPSDTSISTNSSGEVVVTYGVTGGQYEAVTYTNTGTVDSYYNASNGQILQSDTNVDNSDDSSTETYVNYSNGTAALTTVIELNADGSGTVTQNGGKAISVTSDQTVTVDSSGNIDIEQSGQNNTTITTVIAPNGTSTVNVIDQNGNTISPPSPPQQQNATIQELQSSLGTVNDALSLIQAIQNGKPLPTVSSGLTLANNLTGGSIVDLAGASNIASGVLSVLSLENDLKDGDTAAAIDAGAQAASYAAQAYTTLTGQSTAIGDFLNGTSSVGADGVLSSGAGALPYIGIVADLAQGNYQAAAIAVVALEVPVVGEVYAAYEVISSLLSSSPPPPTPWGSGSFVWNADGSVGIQVTGQYGGDQTVKGVLTNMLQVLNQEISAQLAQSSTTPLGLVANRLPSLSYNGSLYTLTSINPLNGATSSIQYLSSGAPVIPILNAQDNFTALNLQTQFITDALANGAIAPQWVAQTAQLQQQNNDPYAGYSSEQIAGSAGKLAGAIPAGATTQSFNPIVLGLNGASIQTTSQAASNVSFDVDDSGYLKSTGWISPSDGFLVLDQNDNGVINTGSDLFSSPEIAPGARGIAELAALDINNSGVLTAADPGWAQLQVWIDANSDGVAQSSELHSLSSLGITQINYKLGTFVQNGQTYQMTTANLTASTQGESISNTPQGILIKGSNGDTTLIVNNVNLLLPQTGPANMARLIPGTVQASGTENVTDVITTSSLIADTASKDTTATGLAITQVSSAEDGTVSLVGGNIDFLPSANYYGNQASFTYTETDAQGQSALGTVYLDIAQGSATPPGGSTGGSNPPLSVAPYVETTNENVAYVVAASYIEQQDGTENANAGNLTITSVGGAQNGTVSLVNGNITFTPTANYFNTSPVAGFTYQETDAAGQTVTGHFNINVPIVKIIPTVTTSIGGPWNNEGQVSVIDQNNQQYTYKIAASYNGSGSGAITATISSTGAWDISSTPSAWVVSITVTDALGESAVYTFNAGGAHPGPMSTPVTNLVSTTSALDPIVLGIGGQGINITPVSGSSTFVDTTGSGYKNQTAWIAPSDGFLVYDPTGTGQYSSAMQLNLTNYVAGSTSDYNALQLSDVNHTGVLNSTDPIWNKLYVWVDANSNGVADPGELETLAQAGVTSINLNSTGQFSMQNGAVIDQTFSATTSTGTQIAAAEVDLPASNYIQVPQTNSAPIVEAATANAAPSTISGDGLLLGTSGDCTITGGNGNDVIMSGDGNDEITDGNGADVIYAGNGGDAITVGTGNDAIYTGNGNSQIVGGGGNDVVMLGSGSNVVFLGGGADLVSTGAGNDIVSVGNGNDSLIGGTGSVAFFSGNGNSLLQGGAGVSMLQVGSGNDTLQAGSGLSTMVGGTGTDVFVVNNAADVVTAQATAVSNTVQTSVNYTLGANVENLTGIGSANLVLTGNTLNNVILGNAGNDTLVAGSGNDTLIAGGGLTTMIGGAGNNTYVVEHSGDVIVTQSGSLSNTAKSNVSYTLAAGVTNLTGIGSGNLVLTGNALANVITANSGNDTLVAGTGNATLVGGTGSDVFVVDNTADVVLAQAANPSTIDTSVSYTAAANVQNLVGTGAASIALTGNTLADTITANTGNDTLISGAGVETLVGGSGNDTFVVNNTNDVIVATVGTDTEQTSVNATLASNLQYLSGIGSAAITLTGNANNDTITGNSSADTLVAGSGVATLNGLSGNDSFVVNSASDVINEAANTGNNTEFSSVSITLANNVKNLTGTGTGSITLTGNTLSNVITANGGNDLLLGGTGLSTLIGGFGDDTMQAGSGVADMVGVAGNQTFVVNNANDVITEAANTTGNVEDTSVTTTLAANVQSLIGTGKAALTLTGNALASASIIGNSGADTLIAGSGNDSLISGSGVTSMVGGAGNDTFVVNNASDVINEAANTGNNTEQTWFSSTLATNVQNLVGLGSAALALKGNVAGGTVTANSGADTLSAGTGATTLIGGTGNDTFIVNSVSDVVIEATDNANDVEQSWSSATLAANVQTLTGLGTGSIALTGNSLSNVITANAGADRLVAGSGATTLIGGAGNDTFQSGTGVDSMVGVASNQTFVVNNVSDVISEAAGMTNNVEQTTVSATLANNVQTLTATGTAAVTLTGNTLTNTITANSAADTLIAEGTGNDTLVSGTGIDTLEGNSGNDTFNVLNSQDVIQAVSTGTNTNTELSWVSVTAAANVATLTGLGSGSIGLTGGSSAIVITANSGTDHLTAGSGATTMIGGAGTDTFTSGTGVDSMVGVASNQTFVVNNASDVITESAGMTGNVEQTTVSATLANNVQTLTGTGTAALTLTGNTLANTITANSAADKLVAGGSANDTLISGTGVDTLVGNAGSDTFSVLNIQDVIQAVNSGSNLNTEQSWVSVTAAANIANLTGLGSGSITLTGNSTADVIAANTGTDVLVGGSGVDALIGSSGVDTMRDVSGANAMLAGTGNATMTGGSGASFMAVGTGTDSIALGSGKTVVAFNSGNGAATIAAGSTLTDTLSLGGGIAYANLTFTKSGNNLILNTGGSNSITFTNWYAGAAYQDITTLQVIEQAASTYSASSSNNLYNSEVEEFSFTQLVNAFNTAGSPASWSLSGSLAAARTSGSNTAAIGGDLAYYNGLNGNLNNLNDTDAVSILQSSSYESSAQTITAWSTVGTGVNPLLKKAATSTTSSTTVTTPKPTTTTTTTTTATTAKSVVDSSAIVPAVRSGEAIRPITHSASPDVVIPGVFTNYQKIDQLNVLEMDRLMNIDMSIWHPIRVETIVPTVRNDDSLAGHVAVQNSLNQLAGAMSGFDVPGYGLTQLLEERKHGLGIEIALPHR